MSEWFAVASLFFSSQFGHDRFRAGIRFNIDFKRQPSQFYDNALKR